LMSMADPISRTCLWRLNIVTPGKANPE
jgi:hypothetical protein